jgi:phosphate transport system protein
MLKDYSDKLDEINDKVLSITEDILEANKHILSGLQECNKELLDNAKNNLKNMSARTTDIDNSIVKILALYSPEAKDLRFAVSFFKISNELLRASSNTRTFISGLSNYCTELDETTVKDFAVPMQKSTIECLTSVVNMIKSSSNDEIQKFYNQILISENKTDEYYELLQDNIYKKAPNMDDFGKFTKILRALRKSEKIADRALDVGTLIHFAKIGGKLGHLE